MFSSEEERHQQDLATYLSGFQTSLLRYLLIKKHVKSDQSFSGRSTSRFVSWLMANNCDAPVTRPGRSVAQEFRPSPEGHQPQGAMRAMNQMGISQNCGPQSLDFSHRPTQMGFLFCGVNTILEHTQRISRKHLIIIHYTYCILLYHFNSLYHTMSIPGYFKESFAPCGQGGHATWRAPTRNDA